MSLLPKEKRNTSMTENLEPYRGSPLIIHHLTDIHVGLLHYEASSKLPFLEKGDGTRNLRLYLDYLKNCDESEVPHLVVISGDLTSYAALREFDAAKKFIRDVKKKLEDRSVKRPFAPEAPQILIVPGNHDLDWHEEDYEKKIGAYASLSEDVYSEGSVLSAVSRDQKHECFYDFGDRSNLFVYLFNSTPLGGTDDSNLKSVHDEIRSAYKSLPANLHEEDQKKVDAALVKLKKYVKQDPGFITQEDLDRATETIKRVPPERFKLAVMHHNSTSVPVDDIETFDTIINAGMVNNMLIKNGFDLVLHGHRHFSHATNERYLSRDISEYQQGIFVLGGSSLGCEQNAPFFEIRLYDIAATHNPNDPYSLITVRQAEHRADKYLFREDLILDEPIDRSMFAGIREIQKAVGREVTPSERDTLKASMEGFMPAFKKLWVKLVFWDSDEYEWIINFHNNLNKYSKMYMVDLQERSSLTSNSFDLYLIDQYEEKLRSIKRRNERKLCYPSSVFEAILYTGWRPLQSHWWEYNLSKIDVPSPGMGMARILVRVRDEEQDDDALRKMDFDHRMFAIPLFVIEPSALGDNKPSDMGIGIGEDGDVMRCYEFDEESGKVKEVNDKARIQDLVRSFEEILENSELQTVEQYLTRSCPTGMLRNQEHHKNLARRYDKTRRPSQRIVNFLRETLKPDKEKKGMDVACGTGNYTLPFADEFGKLAGLDISKDMLDMAKMKRGAIEWFECDALIVGESADADYDCLWCISALHYFSAARQKRFFTQMSLILRPGGVLVVDTEFAEQQASLWLVEFFPSLVDRYQHVCKSVDWYRELLVGENAIFQEVEFAHIECDEEDAFLRVGQRKPELYLEEKIRAGIPAFCEMDPVELNVGIQALSAKIDDKSILEVIRRYEEKAAIKGDIGFIIARR